MITGCCGLQKILFNLNTYFLGLNFNGSYLIGLRWDYWARKRYQNIYGYTTCQVTSQWVSHGHKIPFLPTNGIMAQLPIENKGDCIYILCQYILVTMLKSEYDQHKAIKRHHPENARGLSCTPAIYCYIAYGLILLSYIAIYVNFFSCKLHTSM